MIIFLFQDNASIHTSLAVRAWFAEHAEEVYLIPWPALSPDLNPVETVWAWMVDYMKKVFPHPRTREELEVQVHEAFAAVPAEYCQTLVEAMTRRIAAVIANNGGHTRY